MSDSGDYTYPGTVSSSEPLRQFDLRTAPERLQTYCDSLDRRVERAEAALAAQGVRIGSLQEQVQELREADYSNRRRAETAEAALAELRTEFAFAQVALASANVTYTVNRGVGEALAMGEIDDDTYTCDECGGEGVIITCCDDICVGQGYCMHGDGECVCPKCDGDGTLSYRWDDESDTQEAQP